MSLGNTLHVISTLVDSLRHPSCTPAWNDKDNWSQDEEGEGGQAAQSSNLDLLLSSWQDPPNQMSLGSEHLPSCRRLELALSKVLKHVLLSHTFSLCTHSFIRRRTKTRCRWMNESAGLPPVEWSGASGRVRCWESDPRGVLKCHGTRGFGRTDNYIPELQYGWTNTFDTLCPAINALNWVNYSLPGRSAL